MERIVRGDKFVGQVSGIGDWGLGRRLKLGRGFVNRIARSTADAAPQDTHELHNESQKMLLYVPSLIHNRVAVLRLVSVDE